jgi:hypothetical protein
MKAIVYVRHAKKRMKDRSVTEGEVETVMAGPDCLMPSVKDRMNAFKFIDGRYLRVTFKEEREQFLVITVTIRRQPFNEGENHAD